MSNIIKWAIVSLVAGYFLNKFCEIVQSDFLEKFLNENLILILVGVLAINTATIGIILLRLGELSGEHMTEDIRLIPTNDPIGIITKMMLIPERETVGKIYVPPQIELRILQNAKVYTYGTVYYSDISGNEHWSQFCFSFTDNGHSMNPEMFHDSCDDLETGQNN
jgi:hypothetical protein